MSAKDAYVIKLVKEQLVYCKFKRFGCTSEIQFTNKKDHELHCNFRPVSCTHANQGCSFKGTKRELAQQ
jgi:hypothetical protein